jgi:16S rRNA (cytosine967-C5)-methyltransferase
LLREAWTLAIEALSWMEMRGLSEPLALARTIKQLEIDDPDAVKLARLLISETVRRQNFIDAFVNEAIKPASLGQFNLGVQAFLRLYVYQTRIARSWSELDVKEADNVVKLARSILGWETLQPVEPFLGTLLTQRPSIVFEHKNDEAQVALRTFHPTWFVKYCFRLFGRKEAIALLESNMLPLPTYVRVNTLNGEQAEILRKLAEDGIEVEKIEQLKFVYKIINAKKPITKTACFREGLIYVQDKASSFAAEAANPAPGMTVVDACSAPGGKTTYFGQLMRNAGHILSLDYSRRRMASWKSEVERMGVEIAESIIVDACGPLPFDIEADLVMLDPPCTGTGVFRRLPSSKWRLTERSIDRMADIQWQMLNNCSEYVKPRGTLVYSTCSITVEENEMLIERFLKWHPEFSVTDISPRIGLPGLRGLDRCQRLYPHIHQCSGLFIAKMSRNNDQHIPTPFIQD